MLREAIIDEVALDQPEESDRDVVGELVDRLVSASELTLFLNGLDEVSAPGDDEERLVDAVLEVIEAASDAWKGVRIVVTCRRSSTSRHRRLPASFVVGETVPFGQSGVEHFVRSYFSEQPERAVRLLEEIDRTSRIRTLVTTPLLLALITLVFEQRGSLPKRRTDIYRRCSALLLQEWDASRGRDRHPRFLVEHKEEFLRQLAWYTHSAGARYITADELTNRLESFLPTVGLGKDQAPELLEEITSRHGLVRTYGDEWYGFIHFALQEYFASECVGTRESMASVLSHRYRAWWQEIIRLHAGRSECGELVRALLSEREDLFHTNLRLAGECLTECTSIEPELRIPVVRSIHETAVNQHIPGLDVRMWRILAQVADKDHVDLLWDAVRNSDLSYELRSAVLEEMSGVHDAFVDQAFGLLSDGEMDKDIRCRLVELTAKNTDEAGIDRLAEFAANPSADESVRASTVAALSEIGGPKVLTLLEALVLGHATPVSVRREAAIGLRTHGVRGATGKILALLSDWHVETAVRNSLASVVGELGEPDALGDIVGAFSDTRLPSSVRTNLAMSLKSMREPTCAPVLLKLLHMESLDYGVRLALADAVGHVVTDSHVSMLRRAYSGPSIGPPIRTRLAIALGSLGERDVVNVLVRLLSDRTARPYLRLEAARVLGNSPDPGIGSAMLFALDSRTVDPVGQELAVLVLELQNDPEVAGPLVERLSDQRLSLSARLRMADALAALGNTQVIDYMISLLDDPGYTPELRGRLALALRRLTDSRDKRALDRIRTMLPTSSEVPEVASLAWHLSEQVGQSIFPEEAGLPSISYGWTPDVQGEEND